jgi:uncharacterized membrane protein YphA (DoxX/SURF4 family)
LAIPAVRLVEIQFVGNHCVSIQGRISGPASAPELAAVSATAGELVVPIFLALGLFGRMSAVALSAVNAMAVYAYAHVLLSEGFEAAVGQHVLWALMLVIIIVFGPGKASLDHLLSRLSSATSVAEAPSATAI